MKRPSDCASVPSDKKTQDSSDGDHRQQSEQSFYKEQMNEFSQEDHLRLAMKSCSEGQTTPEESGIRTASYVSDIINTDDDSESDSINNIRLKDMDEEIENKKR